VYTLDTNAILYYLKDDADAVSILRDVFAENVPVYVSAVTELELFAYSDLSTEEESLIEKTAGDNLRYSGGLSHCATSSACAKTLPAQSTRQCDRRHRDIYRQQVVNA
jgi:hypothetical protein